MDIYNLYTFMDVKHIHILHDGSWILLNVSKSGDELRMDTYRKTIIKGKNFEKS